MGRQRRRLMGEPSWLENHAMESESLVRSLIQTCDILCKLESSTAWDCCVKFIIGGNWLLTLNNAVKPIANKYCEGKLK